MKDLWNNTWIADLHLTEHAQKRIKSAKSSKLTPIKIDTVDLYGYFQGSSGRYETHLDYCPCGDFIRNKKPCKHIYRLAMELGVIDNSEMSTNEKMIPIPKKEKKQTLIALISLLEKGGYNVMDSYYMNCSDEPFHANPQNEATGFLLDNLFWTEIKHPLIFSKIKKDTLLAFLVQHNYKYPKDIKINDLKQLILDKFYKEFKNEYPDRIICTRSEDYAAFHYQLHSYCKKVVDPYSYLANCEQTISIEILSHKRKLAYVIPDSELNRLYYENGHTFDLDIKNNPYLFMDF